MGVVADRFDSADENVTIAAGTLHQAAAAGGREAILLVGDLPYFGPLGFEVVPAGRIALPGPVDPRRVLWRALKPGGTDGLNGAVTKPI